ncbi:MAG TPA: radical SAM protein [Candidatus Polarisedimenticolia bacterium]|nr:radical SAM protein [Candidatus Polarisedimenticolia bacterium]
METDVRRNPALLKLDLYCRGMRIDDSCHVAEDGGRAVLRTRAGLGSGLELVLPGGLWTNVPVSEAFARSSPYVLHRTRDHYEIRRHGERPREGLDGGTQLLLDRSEAIAAVRLAPRPGWYDRATSTGKPMTRVGTLQGTYLGIYPARVCSYWTEKPERSNCHFCSVGLNLGADDDPEKSVDEVMEVVHAAIEESGITYVDFNTGHYEGETYLDILEPYLRRVKRETGLLVGVQTPPHRDLRRYDALRKMGVNRVSFCFEIFDERTFKRVCPGKDREYGLARYLDAVRHCAALAAAGPRAGPWVSNGEIIAGLEPPASSMAAIDWITSVGAIPTVCVFRPLAGTDMEDAAPPRAADLVPVFRRLYDACMERGLPIGAAPNVHVSLVLLPEECRWFSEAPRRHWSTALRNRALRAGLSWRLRGDMRRARRVSRPAGSPRGPRAAG